MRIFSEKRTDRRTGGDRRNDRQTDESDFIGRCPTNVAGPTSAKQYARFPNQSDCRFFLENMIMFFMKLIKAQKISENPNNNFSTLLFWFYEIYIILKPFQCNFVCLSRNLENEENFSFNGIIILHKFIQYFNYLKTSFLSKYKI